MTITPAQERAMTDTAATEALQTLYAAVQRAQACSSGLYLPGRSVRLAATTEILDLLAEHLYWLGLIPRDVEESQ